LVSRAGAQSTDTKPAEAKSDESKSAEAKPAFPRPRPDTYETLYLVNGTQQYDLNDIQTAMRNVLPNAHIFGVPSQHSITLWATKDDLALAKRILADLDKKKSVYRLTYTIAEMEGGKRVGTQTYSMVAVAGEKAELKQGTRVPIATGAFDSEKGKADTQFQYVDVGLTIEATLDGNEDSVRLKTKIEQSSLAAEKSAVSAQDPVIRQSTLQDASELELGKPVVLGTLDGLGSARHQEVEVVAELVR